MSLSYVPGTVSAISTSLAVLLASGLRGLIKSHASASLASLDASSASQIGERSANVTRVLQRAETVVDEWTHGNPTDEQDALNRLAVAQTAFACVAQACADAAATILANPGTLGNATGDPINRKSTGSASAVKRTWP